MREDTAEEENGSDQVSSSENRRPNAEQKAFSSKIMLANPDYLYMACPQLEGYALSINRWGKQLAI